MSELQELQREATCKVLLHVRKEKATWHVNEFLQTVSIMETVGFQGVPVMETWI